MSTEPRRMNDHGFYDNTPPEVDTLKAHIQTLQGRIEALERTVTAMRERDLKVRRAVGQFASAYDLGHK